MWHMFEKFILNFWSEISHKITWFCFNFPILVFFDFFLLVLFLVNMLVSWIDSKLKDRYIVLVPLAGMKSV